MIQKPESYLDFIWLSLSDPWGFAQIVFGLLIGGVALFGMGVLISSKNPKTDTFGDHLASVGVIGGALFLAFGVVGVLFSPLEYSEHVKPVSNQAISHWVDLIEDDTKRAILLETLHEHAIERRDQLTIASWRSVNREANERIRALYRDQDYKKVLDGLDMKDPGFVEPQLSQTKTPEQTQQELAELLAFLPE